LLERGQGSSWRLVSEVARVAFSTDRKRMYKSITAKVPVSSYTHLKLHSEVLQHEKLLVTKHGLPIDFFAFTTTESAVNWEQPFCKMVEYHGLKKLE